MNGFNGGKGGGGVNVCVEKGGNLHWLRVIMQKDSKLIHLLQIVHNLLMLFIVIN